MELPDKNVESANELVAVATACQPSLQVAAMSDLPADFDLSEVWQWFHARLKALGGLSHDDARLSAILNWNEETIREALHAARLHYSEWDGEQEALQAQLEYTTAEYLARRVLKEEPIPAPELRPA